MKEKTFYEIIHNSNKEELTNIILKMDSCHGAFLETQIVVGENVKKEYLKN